MKRISIAGLALGMLLLGSMVTPSIADTLWYNGDYDQTLNRYVSNQISDALNARTYDDFVVPAGGWTINTLYSNNIVNTSTSTITEAYWEIRQGVSAGNGGTLLLSSTSLASLAATDRYLDGSDYNNPEMKVAVTGLDLSLAAGTYWLCVTPYVPGGEGAVSNTVTRGENATGFNSGNGLFCSNASNPEILYVDGNFLFGFESGIDYSMGIEGTVGSSVPIPPSILLLASALLAMSAHGFWVRER